jgi:RNA polymerase sigma-70 factor (ECF subfamily)
MEPDRPEASTADRESTAALLRRASTGDKSAAERLLARFLPGLSRFASGRLPSWARGLVDTDDLVQDVAIRSVGRFETFQGDRTGAFLSYLRQSVLNRVRDEIRRAKRRPPHDGAEVEEVGAKSADSPVARAVGAEAVERYDRALERLSAAEREAIVARVELGLAYADVAEILGKAGPDAARMAVSRALVKLADEMDEGEAP